MDKIVCLGIVTGAVAFLCGTKKGHKLGNCLIEMSMLFIIIIIMCANNNSGDALAYKSYFNFLARYGKNPWDTSYEFFTQCVLNLVRLTNVTDYGKIRALIFSICWLVIVITYKKYIFNFIVVCFFYIATFMFAHDGAQIKNFCAVTLLLVACSFLIERKKHYLLKYYMVIFGAVLMHFSCFVYIFLPFINTKWFKKNNRILPWVGGGCYVFMFVFGAKLLSGILGRVAELIPLITKVARYLNLYSGKRSLIYVSVYFAIYIILRLFCSLGNSFSRNFQNNQILNFEYTVVSIWKLMGVCLPLLIYANAVFRIYRNLAILLFISMANHIAGHKRFSENRIKNSFYALTIVFVLLLQPIVLGQAIDIFEPVWAGEFFWNY